MKRALILAALLCTGCVNPTEPSCTDTVTKPMQPHSITATMPDGKVVWVCSTQPRSYSTGLETDHYVSLTPCPEEPIK